jgi:MoxR-like ATPase
LLTLINERIFHNGRERIPTPLITMFGASNELPDEEELSALYDRFMFRFITGYITEDFHFLKMLDGAAAESRTTLSFAELNALAGTVAMVKIPGAIFNEIAELRRSLGREQIVVSDRRWKNSLDVLRAHAIIFGRSVVIEDDLMFLEHVLWKDPEERPKVTDLLRRLVRGYQEEARELLIQSQELRDYAQRPWESNELRDRAVVEAHTKIANILVKFETLLQAASDAGRTIPGADAMRSEVREIQQAMLRRTMGT